MLDPLTLTALLGLVQAGISAVDGLSRIAAKAARGEEFTEAEREFIRREEQVAKARFDAAIAAKIRKNAGPVLAAPGVAAPSQSWASGPVVLAPGTAATATPKPPGWDDFQRWKADQRAKVESEGTGTFSSAEGQGTGMVERPSVLPPPVAVSQLDWPRGDPGGSVEGQRPTNEPEVHGDPPPPPAD